MVCFWQHEDGWRCGRIYSLVLIHGLILRRGTLGIGFKSENGLQSPVLIAAVNYACLGLDSPDSVNLAGRWGSGCLITAEKEEPPPDSTLFTGNRLFPKGQNLISRVTAVLLSLWELRDWDNSQQPLHSGQGKREQAPLNWEDHRIKPCSGPVPSFHFI